MMAYGGLESSRALTHGYGIKVLLACTINSDRSSKEAVSQAPQEVDDILVEEAAAPKPATHLSFEGP